MFSPGETICCRFTIPFKKEDLHTVMVSFKQDNDIVFDKVFDKTAITSEDNFIPVSEGLKTQFDVAFTQEESLLFEERKITKAQVNVINDYGSRLTSKEIRLETSVQHYKEVIEDGT